MYQAPLCIPQHILAALEPHEISLLGRVFGEEKSHHFIWSTDGSEKMFSKSPNQMLSIGDWIVYTADKSGVSRIIPEVNSIIRLKGNEQQKIAANVEQLWIITSANEDFNLNRIDRFVQIATQARATATIILTKSDLIDQASLQNLVKEIEERIPHTKVLPISILKEMNCQVLRELLIPSQTVALMGSSGVGKSTMINWICGTDLQKTETARKDGKGRHTTTNRRMFILQNGCFIMDNPGIRSVASTEFQESETQHNCRFRDCTHTNEPGCSIKKEASNGTNSQKAYDNLQKIRKESSKQIIKPSQGIKKNKRPFSRDPDSNLKKGSFNKKNWDDSDFE